MPGSSWTGSAQDESEDLASRVANSIGEAGAGRQSLTDAIVQRVVETVRAAVIVTTESMAELSTDLNERYDRLEGQIGALAEHLSGGPALAAAPVAGGFDRFEAIIDRLERVEALLDRPTVEAAAAQSAPEIDMTPVWETIEALRHELIARTGDSHPVDELRDDLVEVRRALADLTEMASTPAAAPTFSPADDIMVRIDGLETALRSGLAQIADAVMASDLPATEAPRAATPVDLSPVVEAVGARLAELRGSLQGRFDNVEAALRAQNSGPHDTFGPSQEELIALFESTSESVRTTIEQLGRGQVPGHELRSLLSDMTGELEDVRHALVYGQEAAALQQEALAGRLAALQQVTSSTPEQFDQLRDALVAIQEEAASRADDLRGVIAATAGDLATQVAELQDAGGAAQPVDLTPVQDALAAAADDNRVSLDRLSEDQRGIRSLVDYVAQMNDSYHREVLETVGGSTNRLSAELAGMRTRVEAGVDYTPVVQPLADIQRAVGELAGELAMVRRRVELETDLTPVTAPLAELHHALDVAAARLGVELSGVQQAVAEGRSDDQLAGIHRAVEAAHQAVDGLGRELETVRQRVERDTDFTPVTGPLAGLHQAVDAATDRFTEALGGLQRAVDHGPDFTAVTDRLAALSDAIAATVTAVEASRHDEQLADIRTAVVAARGSVTLAHEGLAQDLEQTRRQLAEQIDIVAAAISDQAGIGQSSIDQLTERLAGFERSTSQLSSGTDQVLNRLANLETEVVQAAERLETIPARLSEVTSAADKSAEGIAAIAHWTSVHDTPEKLEQLAAELDGKLDRLASVVPALETGLIDTRSAFDTVSESIVSSLDGLRAHLTASGGFTVQSERLRELRLTIDALVDQVKDSASPSGGGDTTAALRTLQATVDALLVRLEDRNRDVSTKNAALESLVSGSARQLEDHVKSVLGGLGTNERLVRSRFDELATAVGGVRTELTQIRSLRAEVAELGAGLDGLRNRIAREDRFAPR